MLDVASDVAALHCIIIYRRCTRCRVLDDSSTVWFSSVATRAYPRTKRGRHRLWLQRRQPQFQADCFPRPVGTDVSQLTCMYYSLVAIFTTAQKCKCYWGQYRERARELGAQRCPYCRWVCPFFGDIHSWKPLHGLDWPPMGIFHTRNVAVGYQGWSPLPICSMSCSQ